MSNVNLDHVILLLSSTLFSYKFCIFSCLALFFQPTSIKYPFNIAGAVWTGLLCLIAWLRIADNVYSHQRSWFKNGPKLDWDRQIVLITGGGSGIGALLARTLATRDVKVVVMTLPMQQINTDLDNRNIHNYTCDVSNYEDVVRTSELIRKEIGDPTIIVNNAGVVKGKLLLDLTKEDIERLELDVSHFWVLKAFLPAMIQRKAGHIVTVSSVMGLVGAAQMTDYCASKAALISLYSSLRFELDNRHATPGIRTTLLLPSFILTSLFSKTQMPSSKWFRFLAPPLQPDTVVQRIVAALGSDESSIIRLPWYTNLARIMSPGVGLMPKCLIDSLQWLSGADHAMSKYGPHPDAAERLRKSA